MNGVKSQDTPIEPGLVGVKNRVNTEQDNSTSAQSNEITNSGEELVYLNPLTGKDYPETKHSIGLIETLASVIEATDENPCDSCPGFHGKCWGEGVDKILCSTTF